MSYYADYEFQIHILSKTSYNKMSVYCLFSNVIACINNETALQPILIPVIIVKLPVLIISSNYKAITLIRNYIIIISSLIRLAVFLIIREA